MTIQVGDHLPQATFRVIGPEGPVPKTTDDVFKAVAWLLVAVPAPSRRPATATTSPATSPGAPTSWPAASTRSR